MAGPTSATTGRSLVVLVVLAVAMSTAPAAVTAQHPTLSVGDASVTEGETATVAVTLSAVPHGLSGFNVTVTVADADAATLTDVSVEDSFGEEETAVSADGETAVLKAADTGSEVGPGDDPVRLGTVTVRADNTAGTSLSLDVEYVHDEDGDKFRPATSAGQLSVGDDDGDGSDSGGSGSDPGGSDPGGDDGDDSDGDGDGDDPAGNDGSDSDGSDTSDETATETTTATETDDGSADDGTNEESSDENASGDDSTATADTTPTETATSTATDDGGGAGPPQEPNQSDAPIPIEVAVGVALLVGVVLFARSF